MLINISIDRVVEDIYASSALYLILNGKKQPPKLLHRDHRPALDRAVRHAFTIVCFKLLPFITDCSVADADEMLSIELRLPDGYPSAAITPLRKTIEYSMLCETLAGAYANYDDTLAETNSRHAADAIKRLRAKLDDPCGVTLTGSW